MAYASPDDGAAESVGAALARMRRGARLTGQQLARMVGMSQAKISRIETGQTSASPADVARLARALGASDETVEGLAAQAGRIQNQMSDWRQRSDLFAIGSMQDDLGSDERKASVIRIFQPSLIVGLAQTSEYARAIISAVSEMYESFVATRPSGSVTRAVTARVRRQELLTAADHQFRFVMSETALSSRLASPSVMIAQIERLRELGRRENIHLKFLLSETQLPFPLLHGFELLDDSGVIVDVFNTALSSRGSADAAGYRAVFDRLEAAATSDIEPILKKYRDVYLRELTRDDAGES